MEDKSVKKLKREELLELLIQQKKENEELRIQLDAARKQLEDKNLLIEKSGSIAEASYMLNGLFEAAQETVLQYLHNTCREKSAVPEGAVSLWQQEDLETLREQIVNLTFKKKSFGGYDCEDVEQKLQKIVSAYETYIEKERTAHHGKIAEYKENIDTLRMLTTELNRRNYNLRKDRRKKNQE